MRTELMGLLVRGTKYMLLHLKV